MKFHRYINTVFLVLAGLAFYPAGVSADSSRRFEKGLDRCFNDYLQFTDESLSTGDVAGSDMAARSFRCVKRYESRLPGLRSVKRGGSVQAQIWALEDKIEKLDEKIAELRKKAQAIAPSNVGKAIQLANRREKLKQQRKQLKQKLQNLKKKMANANSCTPAKTRINVVFENNSDIPFIVYIKKYNGSYVELFSVQSRRIKTWTTKLSTLKANIGAGSKKAYFQLRTVINGSPVSVLATMRIKGAPKQKPCQATARFEIFDSTFPAPKAQYYVFGVQAGNSPSYFIGLLSQVAVRTPCSFDGGGLDCTSKVKFNQLAGPFSTYSAAQQGFCNGIKGHEYWQFTSCHNRYKWVANSTWYWGCEGSVTSAISKYCPNP